MLYITDYFQNLKGNKQIYQPFLSLPKLRNDNNNKNNNMVKFNQPYSSHLQQDQQILYFSNLQVIPLNNKNNSQINKSTIAYILLQQSKFPNTYKQTKKNKKITNQSMTLFTKRLNKQIYQFNLQNTLILSKYKFLLFYSQCRLLNLFMLILRKLYF
ncbi:hypothetical protein ABPG74_018324 [Tetrahymena malaccensis]